jgi:hypothetical protein
MIQEVGDVMKIDWYSKNRLDHHWLRVKLALPDISFLPPPQVLFEYSGKSKILHF